MNYHVIFLCYTSEKHSFVLHVRSQKVTDPSHYK